MAVLSYTVTHRGVKWGMEANMQKWELTTKLVDISKVAIGGPRPELSKLWTEKNKKTGAEERT